MEQREPPAPPIHLGASIEQKMYDRARESPLDRGGFHVSDAVGKRGWRCDRYVQLILRGAERNATDDRKWRIKRYELGDAYHQWIYRNARSAIIDRANSMGQEVLQVCIESPFRYDDAELVGTPDLVIYHRVAGSSRTTISVYDIKSTTPAALKRMTGKKGINLPKEYKRQLLTYCEVLGADYGWFTFAVTESPYDLIDEPIDPTGRILPDIQARYDRLKGNLTRGAWPGLVSAKSYCTDCPLRVACNQIGPHPINM